MHKCVRVDKLLCDRIVCLFSCHFSLIYLSLLPYPLNIVSLFLPINSIAYFAIVGYTRAGHSDDQPTVTGLAGNIAYSIIMPSSKLRKSSGNPEDNVQVAFALRVLDLLGDTRW